MSSAQSQLRILVVDDIPDIRVSLRMLFELLGCQARTAACGKDAMAEIDSFDPHVVVLDLGLPDVSGYDVARHCVGVAIIASHISQR